MVIDLSNVSISKDWDYDQRAKRINQVTIDFDEQDKEYDPEFSSRYQFQSFQSIDDVKAFILELWGVAKETWPNESE